MENPFAQTWRRETVSRHEMWVWSRKRTSPQGTSVFAYLYQDRAGGDNYTLNVHCYHYLQDMAARYEGPVAECYRRFTIFLLTGDINDIGTKI